MTQRNRPSKGEQPGEQPADESRWDEKTGRTPDLWCPSCARMYNAHVPAADTPQDALPTPGSLLVCAYCATPAILQDSLGGLRAVALTPQQRAEEAEFLAPVLEQARREARQWRLAQQVTKHVDAGGRVIAMTDDGVADLTEPMKRALAEARGHDGRTESGEQG